uniref:Uncharacterized protein n=1 Tax=Oryza brachyantha TaxID=4533 RepID=J3N179_ORYBR
MASLGVLAAPEVLHAGEVHVGDLEGLGHGAAAAGDAVHLRLPLQLAQAPVVLHHAAAGLLDAAPQAVAEVGRLRPAVLHRLRAAAQGPSTGDQWPPPWYLSDTAADLKPQNEMTTKVNLGHQQ